MAKKKDLDTRKEMTDEEKVKEWLKNRKNKVKKIPRNVGGECVMKGFYAKKRRNPFQKSTKHKNAT